MAAVRSAEETYALVQDRYGSYARQHDDEGYNKKVATAFGYSSDELESVPTGANLGVSCGNPTAVAGLVNVYTSSSPISLQLRCSHVSFEESLQLISSVDFRERLSSTLGAGQVSTSFLPPKRSPPMGWLLELT